MSEKIVASPEVVQLCREVVEAQPVQYDALAGFGLFVIATLLAFACYIYLGKRF